MELRVSTCFKRAVAAVVVLILWGVGMGCTNAPDLDRIRNINNPEAILYKWFAHETLLAEVDFATEGVVAPYYWGTPESCSVVKIYSDQLNDRDVVEAFRLACERYGVITEKYSDLRLEVAIEKYGDPLGARTWELVMLGDFQHEMQEVRDNLRGDLVCGLGKEHFYDGEHACRQRGKETR